MTHLSILSMLSLANCVREDIMF